MRGGTYFLCRRKESRQRKRAANRQLVGVRLGSRQLVVRRRDRPSHHPREWHSAHPPRSARVADGFTWEDNRATKHALPDGGAQRNAGTDERFVTGACGAGAGLVLGRSRSKTEMAH